MRAEHVFPPAGVPAIVVGGPLAIGGAPAATPPSVRFYDDVVDLFRDDDPEPDGGDAVDDEEPDGV